VGARRVSVAAAAALIAAVGLLCSGCTPAKACSGVSIPVPGVYVDASGWFVAHPGSALRACYGSRCATITAANRYPTQLLAGKARDARLTITSTSGPVLRSVTDVALKQYSEPTACGPVRSWGQDVTVDANGTLATRGWEGRAPDPAYPRPTGTATP